MRPLWIALALCVMAPANAQPAACATAEYRQFDFWVGEWEVKTPDGKLAGHNRIEKVLGGCALHESWTGASGGRGHSYNAYDAQRKVWHQTWVDRQGSVLLLEGGLKDGAMVLANAGNRITWTPRKGGTVTQVWETTADQGASWKTVFHGVYRLQR